MKQTVTVIPADGVIIVDGQPVQTDFGVSGNVHAIQWHEKAGHVEYADGRQHLLLNAEMYDAYVAPFVAIWEGLQHQKEPALSLKEAEAYKQTAIVEGASEAIRKFSARYSQCEEGTWPLQEAGARAILGGEEYTKNSQAVIILDNEQLRERAVELVAMLAAERGLSLLSFAEKIVSKADACYAHHNRIFGRQRALEKKLAELVTLGVVEHVLALPVDYS